MFNIQYYNTQVEGYPNKKIRFFSFFITFAPHNLNITQYII